MRVIEKQQVKFGELANLTRLWFILKGLVVGVLVGLTVSVFRLLIEKSLAWLTQIYQTLDQHPLNWLWLLIANLIVGLIVAVLLKQEPNISGSGIPQVEGQLAGEFDLPWWSILWRKFIGGVLSIGTGLFLGREGPSIQLGATIGQGVAAGLHQRGTDRRILIAGGSAAGLSAAFNAPIAGTLFVLEEIYHNFSPLVWMTSLASAIAANFVSLNFFGLTPVLQIAYNRSLPVAQYWHLLPLGIVLGLSGFGYQKILLALPKWYQKLRLPRQLNGLVPLVLMVPVGYFWPQLLGGGNTVITSLGHDVPALKIVLIFFIVRFIFSMVSYGSGLPGGIFLPILTLGALIGALYGLVMIHFGLLPATYLTNLIIFSMAGYFAGIGKAPFTAILLVTEMVGSLSHLMPLAILSLVAYIVVDLLGGAPIYESLLGKLIGRQKGIRIKHADQVEIPVFAGSPLEDRQVRALKWPQTCLLIAVRRGENEILPHGDTLIRAGDTLVVLTDHKLRAQVRREIEKAATQIVEAEQHS